MFDGTIWISTVYIPCKGPSYLGKTVLVSIWFKNAIDPNLESGAQRFSHLVIPTEHQYLIGIAILTPIGTFF